MKIVYIVLSVIAVAFIAVQIFALKSQKNIETYPYVVNEKYDQFEIRRYEVTLFKQKRLTNSHGHSNVLQQNSIHQKGLLRRVAFIINHPCCFWICGIKV